MDAGVFFSNVGMESWVSRDNATYTRSLVADYSPYYSAGVKAAWQATPRLAVRVDVVNGWQNVSESNAAKSAGVRLDYVAGGTTVSYYALAVSEAPGGLRALGGVGVRASPTRRLELLAQADAGRQARPGRAGATRSGGVAVTSLSLGF